MKKSILEIYSLAVCFATLVCFAITSGILLYQVVRISDPEFTLSAYRYDNLYDNDNFWKSIKPDCNEYIKEGCGDAGQRPSDDELTKKREVALLAAKNTEVREAKQSLLQCFLVVLVDLLIFFPHWAMAKRARESSMGH